MVEKKQMRSAAAVYAILMILSLTACAPASGTNGERFYTVAVSELSPSGAERSVRTRKDAQKVISPMVTDEVVAKANTAIHAFTSYGNADAQIDYANADLNVCNGLIVGNAKAKGKVSVKSSNFIENPFEGKERPSRVDASAEITVLHQ